MHLNSSSSEISPTNSSLPPSDRQSRSVTSSSRSASFSTSTGTSASSTTSFLCLWDGQDSRRRSASSSMPSWDEEEEGGIVELEKMGNKHDRSREQEEQERTHLTNVLSESGAKAPQQSTVANASTSTPQPKRNITTSSTDDAANTSPASSATSSPPFKDGITPRAELPPPLWPLSVITPSPTFAAAQLPRKDETGQTEGGAGEDGSVSRRASLRRKDSSLDAILTSPLQAMRPLVSHSGPTSFATGQDSTATNPFLQDQSASQTSTSTTFTANTASSTKTASPPSTDVKQNHHSHTASASIPERSNQTAAAEHSVTKAYAGSPITPFSSSSRLAQKNVESSETTGCSISAPISAPAHYPLPTPLSSRSSHSHSRSSSQPSSHLQFSVDPASPSSAISMKSASSAMSSSTASSSSSTSSNNGSSSKVIPPPPRWARPPTKTTSISGRANSMSSNSPTRIAEHASSVKAEQRGRPCGSSTSSAAAQSNPADFNQEMRGKNTNGEIGPEIDGETEADFDPELFEGKEGEWIEIIKGSEGRIAVRSTPGEYLVLVWLPGFQVENITIATRGSRTIHLVADQWDEGDHAQWDIKLGTDANLAAVTAKFSGDELRISVARQKRSTSPDTWWGTTDPKIPRDPISSTSTTFAAGATPSQPVKARAGVRPETRSNTPTKLHAARKLKPNTVITNASTVTNNGPSTSNTAKTSPRLYPAYPSHAATDRTSYPPRPTAQRIHSGPIPT